jgi:hypothetical protein
MGAAVAFFCRRVAGHKLAVSWSWIGRKFAVVLTPIGHCSAKIPYAPVGVGRPAGFLTLTAHNSARYAP